MNSVRNLSPGDIKQLRKWNWGSFTLGPIWALANQLEYWAILYFIPPINVFIIFYMATRGNELALQKSDLSYDDFLKLQMHWSRVGFRFFLFYLIAPILYLIGSVVFY